MSEIGLQEFDRLSDKEQRTLVNKALAWFCVQDVLNPYLSFSAPNEVAAIKIVLGKFVGGE